MDDSKKNVDNLAAEGSEDIGSVKLADEVMSIMAGLAAASVEGVAGMSAGIVGGITEMLGKQNYSKGVKIITSGKTVVAEIYVIIKYGYIIPDVAIAIQEKVKKDIENMTGYEVTAVDVHVEGIKRNVDKGMEEYEEEAKAAVKEVSLEKNDEVKD